MAQLKLSNNVAKLHQMFGKKLYANKYSFISELAQNAVDSHRMAGQTEPVIVGIKENTDSRCPDKWMFYVKDNGLSFEDQEDFVNKVCTLLESGKSQDKDNNEDTPMGMHGIGSIAVSAYQPSWRYTVCNNGWKFQATLQEIPGKGLDYSLGEYEGTTEEKYVLVEVGVPAHDLSYFIKGMLSKLAYFKDIIFELDEEIIRSYRELLTINTSFKILQSDDFQLSTLSTTKVMHICLDQYHYPISWDTLGIPPINLNIGLKFGLGDGLEADITRENLVLSNDYRTIVLDKIRKVASWFTERYNTTVKDEYDNLTEIQQALAPNKLVYLTVEGEDKPSFGFVINEMLTHSNIPLKHVQFKGVSDEVLDNFLKKTNAGAYLFRCSHTISAKGHKVPVNFAKNPTKDNSFYVEKDIPKKILRYIKAHRRGDCNLFERIKLPCFAKQTLTYDHILNLRSSKTHMKQLYQATGINIWREKIKMFNILVDAYQKENFTRIEDIKIDPLLMKKEGTSVINRKAKISLEDMTGEIGIGYPKSSYSSSFSCKFVEKVVQVKDLHKAPYFHVYATKEERALLDSLYAIISRNSKIQPCVINKTSQKSLKKLNLHNFMDIKDFMAGKHPLFRKIITAYIIDSELLIPYGHIISEKDLITKEISTEFGNDLSEIVSFCNNTRGTRYNSIIDPTFIKSAVDLAHELGLYDLSIWEKYQKVKEEISNFDFVDVFSQHLHQSSNESFKARTLEAMKDVCRARKIRMNWKNYKINEHN